MNRAMPTEEKLVVNFERSMMARREQDQRELEARRARRAVAEKQGAEAVASLEAYENELARSSFQSYGKWSTRNFDALEVLGKGSWGMVTLVRHEVTNELFAVKMMEKERFEQKNYREKAFWERDAMSEARSRWTVELFATFQDSKHIYMVMEFVQGGDLLTHLQLRRRFTHEETRFYTAELIEAIGVVHQCGMVHRDLKPENVVMTVKGHLKLLDFGLCTAAGGGAIGPRGYTALDSRATADQPRITGTPHYMAPESFEGRSGQPADLWAIGIHAYEFAVGMVPFHPGDREGPEATALIMEYVLHADEILPTLLQKYAGRGLLQPATRSFVAECLRTQDRRITLEGMRRHELFAGLRFQELHLMTPPIIPQFKEDLHPDQRATDTSYFSDFKGLDAVLPYSEARLLWDRSLDWAGFAQDGRAAEALRRPDM